MMKRRNKEQAAKMNSWMLLRILALVLVVTVSPVLADLNILTIGDSLSAGRNDDATKLRASYRPYLDQSIRNFQNLTTNNTDSVTVNWLGDFSSTAYVPSETTPSTVAPIVIGPEWSGPPTRDRHQARSGTSSFEYENDTNNLLTNSVAHINGTGATDDNMALVLLGTNDFAMFADPSVSNSSATGWNSNRYNPLDVINSIQNITLALQQADPDIKVLIAAIPPVDQRRQYDPNDTSAIGNLWTETQRLCTKNGLVTGTTVTCNGTHQDLVHWNGTEFVIGPGADGANAPAVTDSNDIVGVVNRELKAWANLVSNPNVGFVDPLEPVDANNPSSRYQLMGPNGTVDVNGGGSFDLSPDGAGELDHLSDGIHLTAIGDQFYAASFWDQGVRAQLITTANQQGVPEPSSFLFLGMLTLGGIAIRRIRRHYG